VTVNSQIGQMADPNYWTAVDELLESFNLAPFGARFRSRSAAYVLQRFLPQPHQLVTLSRADHVHLIVVTADRSQAKPNYM